MKIKIYNFLVNRHAGIKNRYHQYHDNAAGITKILSWIYLIWLNLLCLVTFQRFPKINTAIDTKKELPINKSESEVRYLKGKSVDWVVDELMKYDVISFDIFDTLVLRPFSKPSDLFYLIGNQLEIPDFKRIREEAEYQARIEKYSESGTYEVTLFEIWSKLHDMIDIPIEEGMRIEQEYEEILTYSNPFMKEVFMRLMEAHKRIIVVSDMYLSEKFLKKLLVMKAYFTIEKIYVSSEYGKSKANGKLFEYVLDDLKLEGSQIIHVGDNKRSDVKMPGKYGIRSLYYPNVNECGRDYRAYEMTNIIGSAYRGLVNNHIYNGLNKYSMEYEYGYIYGGLFVVGYCSFIHDYVEKNEIDKVLFLSRDGDILKQVYEELFDENVCRYAYWSRNASTKLMAESNKYDYFRRFLFHKVNQGISLKKIFSSMDMLHLLEDCLDFVKERITGVTRESTLDDKNVLVVKDFFDDNWDRVVESYKNQQIAARQYYQQLIGDSKKVAAVDIGWAGSGAMSLRYLFENKWNMDCEVIGLIAGTNTIHNAEPDSSDAFLQSKKLVSYLYSFGHNRELMKHHDLNKNFNVYWELLLSSPTSQFLGFGLENGKYTLKFGELDANQSGIKEIQRGILDFADEYVNHFGRPSDEEYSYMYNISGSDAYAPVLSASRNKEKYLKKINSLFDLQINVN